MFIDILFIIVLSFKKPNWLSTGEWIRKKKLWHIHIVEYYSARRNGLYFTVWMNCKNIILNERSPT